MIGLIPEAACERESEWMRQLIEFDPQTKVLERRLGPRLHGREKYSGPCKSMAGVQGDVRQVQ